MYQTIKASFKAKHKKRINGSVAFSSSYCIYYYYLLFDPKVIRKMLFFEKSYALQIDMVSYIVHSKAVHTATVRILQRT